MHESTSTGRGARTPVQTPQELGVMISNSSFGELDGSGATTAYN